MPRPVVLSNGRLYVGMDRRGVVRELCWPNVGFPNHLVDGGIRLGVWVEGEFSWLDGEGWEVTQEKISPVVSARTLFYNPLFGVRVRVDDWVDTDDVWHREILVENHRGSAVHVRLYQAHDLHIDESDIGDTAMFDPQFGGVVHFKGSHWIGFRFGEGIETEYSCGVKRWGGLEGTWRDAEDGHLSMKAIEQGRVDSVMGTVFDLEAKGSVLIPTFVVCAGGRDELLTVDLEGRGSERAVERFRPTVVEWEEHDFEIVDISWQQVLNHLDKDGGVLAACDSDIMATARANYNYVWFRDGALVASMLAELGDFDAAERFWSFFLRCVGEDDWAWQKYTVRGEKGASWLPWVVDGERVLPIQQDESALPVWLGLTYGFKGGRETCERLLDHMVAYRDENGLPGQSWDLWEERRGAHFWTTVTVIEALRAGAEGEFARSDEYGKAAERMIAAVKEVFWVEERGCLARTLVPDGAGGYRKDMTADSSVLLGVMFGSDWVGEGWLAATAGRVEKELSVRSGIGGVARYPGDYYFRRSEAYPGNPWVICTLWLARAKMLLAGSLEEAEGIFRLAMEWCEARAETTYVLAEQFHPDTGEPLSVGPLTWSHAEVLETALLWERMQNRD